ncbi:MAG: hypothetical protein AAF721_31555, partial [Myxococcota bacterium]
MLAAKTRALGGFVLLLAAAGCGAEAPVPEETLGAELVRTRAALRPGDVHRYEFAWTVESGGEVAVVGGAHITGGIALSGELAVEVLADDGDDFVLGVRFTRLDEAVLAMSGHNVLPSPQLLLGHQGVLIAPRNGRPQTLRIDPAAPPVFRTLLEGLIAHVDLSVPPSDGSRTDVGPTGNGLAQLQYRWSPTERDVIEREIVRYERVDALRGGLRGPQWDVDGRARIEVGDDALVQALEVSEILTLAHAEDPFDFGAETSFSMRRTAVERGPGEAPPLPPELETWPTRDLFAPPDYTEADRVLAQSFAEGLTTTELIIAVQSAGRGLPPPKGFLVRARGLLR